MKEFMQKAIKLFKDFFGALFEHIRVEIIRDRFTKINPGNYSEDDDVQEITHFTAGGRNEFRCSPIAFIAKMFNHYVVVLSPRGVEAIGNRFFRWSIFKKRTTVLLMTSLPEKDRYYSPDYDERKIVATWDFENVAVPRLIQKNGKDRLFFITPRHPLVSGEGVSAGCEFRAFELRSTLPWEKSNRPRLKNGYVVFMKRVSWKGYGIASVLNDIVAFERSSVNVPAPKSLEI